MKQQHFRNEKEYYEFLDYINKECKAGKISTDEKDLMAQMATNEESARRRTEFMALKELMGEEKINKGESGYYTNLILDYLDEKYYNCEYNLYELKKAMDLNFASCVRLLKDNRTNKEYNEACKIMFDDLQNNKLNLLDYSGEDLYKIYIERV